MMGLTNTDVERIHEMYEEGCTYEEIAKEYKLSKILIESIIELL